MKKLFLTCILLHFTISLSAQKEHTAQDDPEQGKSEQQESVNHEEHEHHKHAIGLAVGHAHISTVLEDGETTWRVLPAWGFFYNYLFDEKWALGLHGDMIVESFAVKDESSGNSELEEGLIERSYPFSFVLAGTYHPLKYLGISAGPGIEYEADESFGLVRVGLEPKWQVSKNWELYGSITYDFKFEAYDTWNIGVGMARLF